MTFAKSTTSDRTYSKKNARGGSHKTIAPGDTGDGGSDVETRKTAKKIRAGKPGIGLRKGSGPAPYAERNMNGGSFKTVAPRAQTEGGQPAARHQRLDMWARGKRATP